MVDAMCFCSQELLHRSIVSTIMGSLMAATQFDQISEEIQLSGFHGGSTLFSNRNCSHEIIHPLEKIGNPSVTPCMPRFDYSCSVTKVAYSRDQLDFCASWNFCANITESFLYFENGQRCDRRRLPDNRTGGVWSQKKMAVSKWVCIDWFSLLVSPNWVTVVYDLPPSIKTLEQGTCKEMMTTKIEKSRKNEKTTTKSKNIDFFRFCVCIFRFEKTEKQKQNMKIRTSPPPVFFVLSIFRFSI